eukprot:GHVT01100970.1.p1 GENE.GHVT01100970.1~~GHVT01100970.1.p1  ORF type:complete len:829 (-),score=144.94 GHVT01100970.1:83-2569(-)
MLLLSKTHHLFLNLPSVDPDSLTILGHLFWELVAADACEYFKMSCLLAVRGVSQTRESIAVNKFQSVKHVAPVRKLCPTFQILKLSILQGHGSVSGSFQPKTWTPRFARLQRVTSLGVLLECLLAYWLLVCPTDATANGPVFGRSSVNAFGKVLDGARGFRGHYSQMPVLLNKNDDDFTRGHSGYGKCSNNSMRPRIHFCSTPAIRNVCAYSCTTDTSASATDALAGFKRAEIISAVLSGGGSYISSSSLSPSTSSTSESPCPSISSSPSPSTSSPSSHSPLSFAPSSFISPSWLRCSWNSEGFFRLFVPSRFRVAHDIRFLFPFLELLAAEADVIVKLRRRLWRRVAASQPDRQAAPCASQAVPGEVGDKGGGGEKSLDDLKVPARSFFSARPASLHEASARSALLPINFASSPFLLNLPSASWRSLLSRAVGDAAIGFDYSLKRRACRVVVTRGPVELSTNFFSLPPSAKPTQANGLCASCNNSSRGSAHCLITENKDVEGIGMFPFYSSSSSSSCSCSGSSLFSPGGCSSAKSPRVFSPCSLLFDRLYRVGSRFPLCISAQGWRLGVCVHVSLVIHPATLGCEASVKIDPILTPRRPNPALEPRELLTTHRRAETTSHPSVVCRATSTVGRLLSSFLSSSCRGLSFCGEPTRFRISRRVWAEGALEGRPAVVVAASGLCRYSTPPCFSIAARLHPRAEETPQAKTHKCKRKLQPDGGTTSHQPGETLTSISSSSSSSSSNTASCSSSSSSSSSRDKPHSSNTANDGSSNPSSSSNNSSKYCSSEGRKEPREVFEPRMSKRIRLHSTVFGGTIEVNLQTLELLIDL